MAQSTFYIEASADDWQDGTDGPVYNGTVITAENFPSFPRLSYGYFTFDTSALPDDCTIDSATMNWYTDAYSKTKTIGYEKIFYIWNGSIYENCAPTLTTNTNNWESCNLYTSDLQYISKTGDTTIRFAVGNPGPSPNYAQWNIRSWDYDGSHTYRAYLTVNYTEAASAVTKAMAVINC